MSTTARITRRAALKRVAAAGLTAPFVFRAHAAVPSETVYHASFGANGQALNDIGALTASKNLKLVAVADVDLSRTTEVRQRFPGVKVYQDWRELLDKEKNLNSVNVTVPNHMHASITMRALQQGLNVYTQKPLTQTLYEARQVTRLAAQKQLVTQMGIQIHSHVAHRTVVAVIQAGTIGKVKEVHSWSGKHYGDNSPRPNREDPVPASMDWNAWLGVAPVRPFLGGGYYHPHDWRKRLDFGTGTFGDMGCHILDPVFTSLNLGAPLAVRSEGGAANADNWGLDLHVHYLFPGTAYTTRRFALHWYDADRRPSAPVVALLGKRPLEYQGSIYVGTEGVLYSPYIDLPVLLPAEQFRGHRLPKPGSEDHYAQFVEAVRGNGKTSAPFSYSGPLTEAVLLGCLATRFPQTTLEWDAANLQVVNVPDANQLIRREPREGWEVDGL